MLLCKVCDDSKWGVSQEADGVHLTCCSMRLMKYRIGEGFAAELDDTEVVMKLRQSAEEQFALVRCRYTIVLPHCTAVVPTQVLK